MTHISTRHVFTDYLLIFILWACLHYAFYIQQQEVNALRNAEWSELKLDQTEAKINVLQGKTEWLLQIYTDQPQMPIASFQCNHRLESLCSKLAHQQIEFRSVVLHVARHPPDSDIRSIKLKQIEYDDENQQSQFFQDYYVSPDQSYRQKDEALLFILITLLIIIFLLWYFKFTQSANRLFSCIIKIVIGLNLCVVLATLVVTFT